MRTPSLYSVESSVDPISLALRANHAAETPDERRSRLDAEAEAKRVSDRIDEELRQERERLRRSRGDVKLLLLGQAESGKSTLQKQFQLMYRPSSLEQERSSWRTVIYFNVVHSLKHILSTLESWDDNFDDGPQPSRHYDKNAELPPLPTGMPRAPSRPESPALGSRSNRIAHLRTRLAPLIATDSPLADRLSGGVSVLGSKGGLYVRSGWQARTVEKGIGRHFKKSSEAEFRKGHVPDDEGDFLLQDIARMLAALKDDVRELWAHPTVKGLIMKRKLKLDEWSEFFLKDITRIAALDYIPTTDDILHARIQTMGVAEHIFDVDLHGKSVTWHLYDVGGARGQRHSWIPYFDTANAIIFVAPVSAFDQYLEEDPRTNRIDDSLQLFTQVCSNALLKSVHLVLFLNKTDLLKAKIDNGLRVAKYITSFGDRANDYETVVQYFRAHFLQVHRRNNENRRVLYTHFTSVVDTKTTQRIIGNVRDSIFRGYLQSAALV
ncbi:Guanine nucleotide-binding protein alpha-4 subunit [Mycena indigotica]|uniref:Guanine nucleotide-binding protein alpha-4 subunit n=1 Tax=Mycena indigotica TaxID=2126181 RepID=A0A8H6T7T4_9AGAR|nr:Guanine nucleotide-binding protein alpha-4 subunit [Mycena indigotica]KAF7312495.1 Guanine nucleotide-binding protein alpha-4 subunit [Mycena indigotica]